MFNFMLKILEANIKIIDEKNHIKFLTQNDVIIKIKNTEEPKEVKQNKPKKTTNKH